MKNIGLNSKVGLLIWSVILGFIIGFFVNNFITQNTCQPTTQSTSSYLEGLTFNQYACMSGLVYRGFPFKYPVTIQKAQYSTNKNVVYYKTIKTYSEGFITIEISNYIFWFVVVLIILSLVRYMIYKKKSE